MRLSNLSTKRKNPLRALGIDLGTTNSVMTEIKWHLRNYAQSEWNTWLFRRLWGKMAEMMF